jgi:hypothetical protein
LRGSGRWLVALAAFAGCRGVLGVEEPIEVGLETSCLRNSDCTGSDVCLFRVCGIPCTEDGDCADGRRCLKGPEGNACVSNSVASCEDEDCPSGLVCVAESCRSECTGDADCLTDQRCVQGTCQGTDRAHDPAAPTAQAGSGGRPTSSTGGRAAGGAPTEGGEGGAVAGVGAAPPAEGGSSGEGGAAPQGGDSSGPCETGALRCSGKRLEQCEDGAWQDSVTCPFVCDPELNACGGSCVPGTPRCNSNVPELCGDDGVWESGIPCDAICSGGTCSGSCEPGTRECNLLTAQECTLDGVWQTIGVCDYVCERGECIGECEPGAHRCRDDHRTREQCGPDGEWGSGALCQYACVDDACTGMCVPGNQSCIDDDLYSCNDQGVGELETDCEFVCRSDRCTGECVPGNYYCVDNALHRCSADGALGAGTLCDSNQICRDGRCLANDPYPVGYSSQLGMSDLSPGDTLYLTRVTLPRNASLRKFGMRGESGTVRFGLYDEGNDRPRNLVAQSDSVNIQSSMGGLVTEGNPQTTVQLSAGNYWIGAVYTATVTDYRGPMQGETIYYASQAFGSALPASISNVTGVPNTVKNYYLMVQDVP